MHVTLPAPDLRALLSDAIAYWEPRRLAYNAVLLAVVLCTRLFEPGLPAHAFSFEMLQQFFLLAVLANVAFCAAYVPDLVVQWSDFRDAWRRARWALLLVGMLFASVLAHFISRGIFGFGG